MASSKKRTEGPIIGIDLGMTSVVSAFVPEPGKPPEVIPSERGMPTLPAAVSFPQQDTTVVGRAAQDRLTTDPTRTVAGIKRLLGRPISSQAVRDLSARVGYQIVDDGTGAAAIDIDGEIYTPASLAGFLLERSKHFAQEHLQMPVKRCVVAVPAYFNADQKDAVRMAGKRAGLEVVRLVHEPTAVALAYGYNRSGDARIAIVDMGGVRLDISIMEITGNVFDVVATGGDAYLGGANLDARLVEWILKNIHKKTGKDLSTEPQLLMKVRTAAEQAKRELTRFKAVDLQIPLEVGVKREKHKIAQLRLTRDTAEHLATDLVQRVTALLQHVLRERGLSTKDIDNVILVGGGTRTPMLRRNITEMFNEEPRSSIPPENVIAYGAALLADSLGRATKTANDVVPEPIGIALSDGRFMKIIDKNSKLPITRRVMIPTVRDNQNAMEVDLFQGATDELIDNDYLGTIVFSGLPDAKAGDAKLVVDLVVDEDRLLKVSSPEDGRSGETFEFETKGHAARSDDGEAPTPTFSVARSIGS